ncbi:putative transposable element, partial [Pseudoloma neurophilia]
RSLMEKLIKICNKDADDWDEVLPIALYCYRRCPIGRLRKSPFEILYGRQPSDLYNGSQPITVIGDEDEFMQKIYELRNIYQENAKERRIAEIKRLPVGRDVDDMVIGEVVYRRALPGERLDKFHPRFIGPCRIIRTNQHGSYVVMDLDGVSRTLNRKDLIKQGHIERECIVVKEGEVLPAEGINMQDILPLRNA